MYTVVLAEATRIVLAASRMLTSGRHLAGIWQAYGNDAYGSNPARTKLGMHSKVAGALHLKQEALMLVVGAYCVHTTPLDG